VPSNYKVAMLNDFSPGLNVDLPEELVHRKELTIAKNADILSRGGIKKRFGNEQKNSTSYSAQVENLTEWTKPNGDKPKLALIGSDLCTLDSSYAKTSIQTLANKQLPHFSFQGKFYFIDGNEYYEYDGSSVSAVTPDGSSDNDLSPIRKCKYAIRHPKSNRFFFAGNPDDVGAVYYSEYNAPNYVKNTSVVYPQENEGEVIGIRLMLDAVLIFYRNGIQVWRGQDPEKNAVWEQVPTSHGALSSDAIEMTTQAMLTLSDAGLYALGPNIIGVPMGTETEGRFIDNVAKDRVMSIINSITNPETAVSLFDRANQELYIAFCDDGTGRNNKVLVYNFSTKGFSLYEDISINDFLQLDDNTILAGTENYIIEMNTGTSDVNVSNGGENIIDFAIQTSELNLEQPFNRKKVEQVFIKFRNYGSSHSFDITLMVDGEIEQTYTISGDDNKPQVMTHRKKTTLVGNTFKIKIDESMYSEMEIYSIGFVYKVVRTDGEIV